MSQQKVKREKVATASGDVLEGQVAKPKARPQPTNYAARRTRKSIVANGNSSGHWMWTSGWSSMQTNCFEATTLLRKGVFVVQLPPNPSEKKF